MLLQNKGYNLIMVCFKKDHIPFQTFLENKFKCKVIIIYGIEKCGIYPRKVNVDVCREIYECLSKFDLECVVVRDKSGLGPRIVLNEADIEPFLGLLRIKQEYI